MARELTHCFVKIPVKPLEEASLDKVRDLERKLGVQIIAFASRNDEYAQLSAEQLKEIDDLGKELDATIVAYSSQKATQRRSRAY